MIFKFYNEIKNRTSLVFLSWFSSFIACYTYIETILFLTIKNITKAHNNNSLYLISTNITEIFSTYLKLAYFISIQFTFILILYQITIFLSPGLYINEYTKLKKLIITLITIFIINIIFNHYFIFPFFWDFFLNYQASFEKQTVQIYFEGKLNEYLNFYVNTYVTISLLTLFFYAQFFIINNINNKIQFIKKYRKLFYLTFILIATTITPPDVISQLFVIIVLISLFEFFFLLIVINTKRYSFNSVTN